MHWNPLGAGHIQSSGSEAGSYLRLIDFVYHSTLDLRVIRRSRRSDPMHAIAAGSAGNATITTVRMHWNPLGAGNPGTLCITSMYSNFALYYYYA